MRFSPCTKTALALALTATAPVTTGCMQLDDSSPITLSTHVDDWRDEMIYQILIDPNGTIPQSSRASCSLILAACLWCRSRC